MERLRVEAEIEALNELIYAVTAGYVNGLIGTEEWRSLTTQWANRREALRKRLKEEAER